MHEDGVTELPKKTFFSCLIIFLTPRVKIPNLTALEFEGVSPLAFVISVPLPNQN